MLKCAYQCTLMFHRQIMFCVSAKITKKSENTISERKIQGEQYHCTMQTPPPLNDHKTVQDVNQLILVFCCKSKKIHIFVVN